MYKISIVIPVYNVEDYLEASFNSILNQTFGFDNLEIIYVDDGSTDSSPNIIKKFEEEYDNVKAILLDESSGFAGKPRNVGIENATADYIMFFDPDDEYLDSACELLYNEIINSDLNFVSANFVQCEDDKCELFNWRYYFPSINPGDRIQLDDVHEDMNVFVVAASVWTKIFKREFIIDNDIRFPVGIAAQDLVFVVECLTKTEGVLYVNEPVVKYNVRHSGSVTSKKTKRSLASYIKAYKLFYNLMKDFDKDYVWLAARSVSSFWFYRLFESDISDSDKVDLLKEAEVLLDEFKNQNGLSPHRVQFLFFEYCYKRRYFDAVEMGKSVVYNKSNYSRNELLDEIKDNRIFLLFEKLDSERIKEIADLFKEHDYDISLITVKDELGFENEINLNSFYDIEFEDDNVNLIRSDDKLTFMSMEELYGYFVDDILYCYDKPLLITDVNVESDLDKIMILDAPIDDANADAVIVRGMELENELDTENTYVFEESLSKDNFAQFEDILFDILTKIKFKYQSENARILNGKFIMDVRYNNLQNRNRNLQNKNKDLQNKNKTLQKDNTKLKDANDALQNDNDSLKKDNGKLKDANKNLHNDNEKLKEANNELQLEYEDLNEKYNSILDSTSWKVTAPLRKIRHLK